MPVRGQGQGELAPFHNFKGETVAQAPTFVGPCRVKLHGGIDKFRVKRYDFDPGILMASPVSCRCPMPRSRIRESIHPLPEDCLSRHDAALGTEHELAPGNRTPMVLIAVA